MWSSVPQPGYVMKLETESVAYLFPGLAPAPTGTSGKFYFGIDSGVCVKCIGRGHYSTLLILGRN